MLHERAVDADDDGVILGRPVQQRPSPQEVMDSYKRLKMSGRALPNDEVQYVSVAVYSSEDNGSRWCLYSGYRLSKVADASYEATCTEVASDHVSDHDVNDWKRGRLQFYHRDDVGYDDLEAGAELRLVPADDHGLVMGVSRGEYMGASYHRWKRLGPNRPANGVALKNRHLANALSSKTDAQWAAGWEFNCTQFANFRVKDDLRTDHYVEVRGNYYQPLRSAAEEPGGARAYVVTEGGYHSNRCTHHPYGGEEEFDYDPEDYAEDLGSAEGCSEGGGEGKYRTALLMQPGDILVETCFDRSMRNGTLFRPKKPWSKVSERLKVIACFKTLKVYAQYKAVAPGRAGYKRAREEAAQHGLV